MSHFTRDPRHNPTSKLLLGRSIAKESEPCATELEQSRIEETHAQESKIPANPVTIRKKKILVGKEKWNDMLACRSFDGDSVSAEISKLVMRLVRRCDQAEIEIDDGRCSLEFYGSKTAKRVEGREFSDTDWLQHIYHGSSKHEVPALHEFSIFLVEYIRAIQGHTGGIFDMGHVAIPHKWKVFLSH